MTVFQNPVISASIGRAIVYVYGKQPLICPGPDAFEVAIETAVSLGADRDKVCIVRAPGNSKGRGYKKILPPRFKSRNYARRLHAEGTWISQPGQAVVLPTRDCMSACFANIKTGVVGLVHCGREASRPVIQPEDWPPALISLVRKIEPGRKREHMDGLFSGSICPNCFPHDTVAGQRLIADFLEVGGEQVLHGDVKDGKLKIIYCNLSYATGHGVPRHNIQIDDTCTRCFPGFSSYRDGDVTDNYTFLVIPNKSKTT